MNNANSLLTSYLTERQQNNEQQKRGEIAEEDLARSRQIKELMMFVFFLLYSEYLLQKQWAESSGKYRESMSSEWELDYTH